MNRIFLASDLHFGHQNILSYEPKRKEVLGATIEEHDAALVARINSKVKAGDTLYLLGDLGMYGAVVPNVKQLNGTKILIRGNHDKESNSKLRQAGIEHVFEEVMLKVGQYKILLSHYPYRETGWKALKRKLFGKALRYNDRRPLDDGKWLLHGHIHSRGNTIPYGRQIHIGIDTHDYYPWSLEEVLKIIGGQRD